VGDPAIKQRNAETGNNIQIAYQLQGIPIIQANNEVRAGIDKMSAYLAPDKQGMPTWRITGNCVNLIREMQRYRWKIWESAKLRDKNNPIEEPHKRDDHAVDSSRYFFSFMPDLKLKENRDPDREDLKRKVDAMLNVHNPVNPAIGMRDNNWFKADQPTEWTAYDDGVGIF
jgi:hypothetical protein